MMMYVSASFIMIILTINLKRWSNIFIILWYAENKFSIMNLIFLVALWAMFYMISQYLGG